MMVDLVVPNPEDVICEPFCQSCLGEVPKILF